MRKSEDEQGARTLLVMSCVLLGGAIALLCCFLFLLICTAGVTQGLFGEGAMAQLAMCACVGGAFIGGLVTVRQLAERTLIAGICVGAVLFLFLLTIGVLFYEGAAPSDNWLMQAAGCLVGGALAGLLGRKPRKKRRK